jgi:hypothetical protein
MTAKSRREHVSMISKYDQRATTVSTPVGGQPTLSTPRLGNKGDTSWCSLRYWLWGC